jgi:hypothetical protein
MTNLLNQKHILMPIILQLLAIPFLQGQVKTQNSKTDIIYKNDSSVLSVKITDITADSVYYKAYWKNSKSIFSLPQTDISRLTFENAFGTAYACKK